MYIVLYIHMESTDDSILPEIVIDDSADAYVETDEESEEEVEPPKSRPPASEIFASQPTIQVQIESEEEEEPQPVAELEIQPIAKPKRQASSKQKEHLARIRVKAAATSAADKKGTVTN